MKLSFFAAIVALLVSVAAAAATDMCSCVSPTSCLTDFETETTPMFKVTSRGMLDVPDSEYIWNVMEFHVEFRGCAPTTSKIIIKSPRTSGMCGVSFVKDVCYLVTVRKAGSSTPPPAVAAYGLEVYSAVSCYFNKPWEDVSFADQTTLYDAPVRAC